MTDTPATSQAPAAPFDGAAVWAVPPHLAPSPRRRRPWIRTALRWTAATVLCVAVGTGTAFGVMAPPRTDLPGLRTAADGRYPFPALTLPPLPPKSPDPQSSANVGDVHFADLRQLLLPTPVGGRPAAGYPGVRGWYPVSSYAKLFSESSTVTQHLTEDGLRHIAATAWTGPDGTRTEVYLLAFRSMETASQDSLLIGSGMHLAAAPKAVDDNGNTTFPDAVTNKVTVRTQAAAAGQSAGRQAFFSYGDIEGVVVMTNPKEVNPATFQQVVTLQSELLQG